MRHRSDAGWVAVICYGLSVATAGMGFVRPDLRWVAVMLCMLGTQFFMAYTMLGYMVTLQARIDMLLFTRKGLVE